MHTVKSELVNNDSYFMILYTDMSILVRRIILQSILADESKVEDDTGGIFSPLNKLSMYMEGYCLNDERSIVFVFRSKKHYDMFALKYSEKI